LDAELATGELRRMTKRLASQPDTGHNDQGNNNSSVNNSNFDDDALLN
jgi:hypothetical protein